MKRFADFQAFSKAGGDLAHWHLNYETVAPYAGITLDTGTHALKSLKPEDYRVEKMKFAKTRDPETNKSINDKTTVFYNAHLTLRDIPEAAYTYIVNGKPALEWVMERQSVSKDNVQRHRERRQPLGHRNHGQCQVSARTLPPRHHREPGDNEDRG